MLPSNRLANMQSQTDGDRLAGQARKAFQSQRRWSPVTLVMASSQSFKVDSGRRSRGQDREVLDQVLARRQLDAGTFPPPPEPARHRAHRLPPLHSRVRGIALAGW
jgi:hypothetical protein